MHAFRKLAVLIALTVGTAAAMAGEIYCTTVLTTATSNSSSGFLTTARQSIGVAEGTIKLGYFAVNGASNSASGFGASARQEMGVASGSGVLAHSAVLVTGSANTASGFMSEATQRVGVAY